MVIMMNMNNAEDVENQINQELREMMIILFLPEIVGHDVDYSMTMTWKAKIVMAGEKPREADNKNNKGNKCIKIERIAFIYFNDYSESRYHLFFTSSSLQI